MARLAIHLALVQGQFGYLLSFYSCKYVHLTLLSFAYQVLYFENPGGTVTNEKLVCECGLV